MIGGTYSEYLIDPQPVPVEDVMLSFDMDAMTWTPIRLKGKQQEPSDPIPLNLVYHSAFRLDVHNIGILWYDYEIDSE
jgi:hypothetical protein